MQAQMLNSVLKVTDQNALQLGCRPHKNVSSKHSVLSISQILARTHTQAPFLPATENPSLFEVISWIFPRLPNLPGHYVTFSSGPNGSFYYRGHYIKSRVTD